MLADAYQIQIVHRTKPVSMTFAEIHAHAHRTPFAELKITNQYARANKDTMDNRKFNVFTLAVDQTMSVQQHIRASIDNVCQHVRPTEAHAVNAPNAMASITMPSVNVDLVSLVIQRPDAMLSAAEVTPNVQPTKHASTANAKVHAKRWRFANKMKFAEFIITSQNAVVRQEQYQKPTEHAEHMTYCAETIAIAHHKPRVSIANALIHAMPLNLAEVKLTQKLLEIGENDGKVHEY